jgi:parvulin-like peptidyl-prolyl isomerase
MNRKALAVVLVLALVAAGFVAAGENSRFSIRELLGLQPAQTVAQAEGTPGGNWAQPSGEVTAGDLRLEDIQHVMRNLDPRQQQVLLGDAETFKRFVQQEADNLSVLAAARANKVHEDANTQFLMQRSAENVLRETYLNRLIIGKIPEGFPTEEQVKDYYEKNKEKFVLGERVHVWQIFLPIAEGADATAAEAVQKQADGILKDLTAGKVSFGEAAARYSQHEPSRFNAGYMGLVRVADLKETIRKPLMALAEDKLSGVIRTESGVHILKRGAVIPEQPISYEEAKDEIRQLLQRQAQAQLRQAVYEQARKTYPVDVADARVEEWRKQLRDSLQAARGQGAGSKSN